MKKAAMTVQLRLVPQDLPGFQTRIENYLDVPTLLQLIAFV
jgi:hypothetical protein